MMDDVEKKSARSSDGGDVEAQKDDQDVVTTRQFSSERRPSPEDNGPEKHATVSTDPNIVDWDGSTDISNPLNWSTGAKVANTSLVIILCFITPLASSMFAPGVPDVLREFRSTTSGIPELVVSIYILGFAFGPLLISPISEIYGRFNVYVVCNVMFLIFTIACAVSSSIAQLIVFRFFAGAFGVCPVTLGGATIADLLTQDKRGLGLSLFSMGPLLGPVIGPIAGAYLSDATTWRWTFWVIAIAYGVCTIAHFFLCHETYAPTLLARKTKRLQKERGNMELRSAKDSGLSNKVFITRSLVRPFKMFFFSPIVALMAIYAAFIYGILYLLYTTFTFVFTEDYNFTSANVGLTYLGSGIGMFLGLFLIGGASDRILKSKAAKYGGGLKPEYRLIPLVWTAWTCPVGLFIYGWTAEYHIQWAVPLFGTLLFGIGIIAALICIQQYLIDAYAQYAASAIAANTVLRSLVGGLLPLAGLTMYDKLGLGWGNSLIAFIALALTPIPLVFYIWGERLRNRTKVTF
ncbi:putative mfs multidrug transporter protein [Zymoseptoria brevis]|uniref:Cercosporin MFS transporter CTB4 n=1 Tax=Zymoseptoria brevis TaxID=1047168 RepID=A0A0F4GN56_9PEZI|nr:putative mfs multidrug transporter protein [Zymoseptoria brevis]